MASTNEVWDSLKGFNTGSQWGGFTLPWENMLNYWKTTRLLIPTGLLYVSPEVESSASCPWRSKTCCSPRDETCGPDSSASGRHPRMDSPSLWGRSKCSASVWFQQQSRQLSRGERMFWTEDRRDCRVMRCNTEGSGGREPTVRLSRGESSPQR